MCEEEARVLHMRPVARINIQTEIVNGEHGHYLVWSVRVKGYG